MKIEKAKVHVHYYQMPLSGMDLRFLYYADIILEGEGTQIQTTTGYDVHHVLLKDSYKYLTQEAVEHIADYFERQLKLTYDEHLDVEITVTRHMSIYFNNDITDTYKIIKKERDAE